MFRYLLKGKQRVEKLIESGKKPDEYMADPHFCQSCQFCVPILGKSKEILRLECWRLPPVPLSSGQDADGKSRTIFIRPRVEGSWKCGEWREKKIGYW
jgi:hypothetical protein